MRILLTALFFGLVTLSPHAHADGGGPTTLADSFLQLNLMSIAIWSFALLLIVVGAAILTEPKTEMAKKGFFWTIALISTAVTLLFIAQTTVKNILSETKGPVHWHADFRIVTCGEEQNLLDPTGLLNRIGTPSVHEHNDGRIHIEGTMMSKSDASLGSFFEKIDGELSASTLSMPTNDGQVTFNNGDACDNGAKGTIQVFAWTVKDGKATQRKLENYSDYVMAGHSPVPPGDCIIIEFGTQKQRTELLCTQYAVADKNGDLEIEGSYLK